MKEFKNNPSTPHFGNTLLAEGLWCIKVQANHDCWIADWDGDPGRTLVKENAKNYESNRKT